MKGMGQVAAGSTGLIQQGHILIWEMESLPKRNLFPWCLPSSKCLTVVNWQSAQLQTEPKPNLLPLCLKSWLTYGQCSRPLSFSLVLRNCYGIWERQRGRGITLTALSPSVVCQTYHACTVWGVPWVAMFCFVFFQKLRLPIGLHSHCKISPTAGGTFHKCFKKCHIWGDAPQCI